MKPDQINSRIESDLVTANRILASEGIFDAFGHVSVRLPERTDVYLIARRVSPEVVTAEDLQVHLLNGDPADGDSRPQYAERFIHGAIYEMRPDVSAICHSHSPSTIPFGVTGQALRPIYHMASLLGPSVPVWDIADDYGDRTDLMVHDLDTGRSLARSLGSNTALLMRGHGNVAVGSSLPEVVLASTYLEENAKLQRQALALGEVKYMSDGEIEQMAKVMRNPVAAERAFGRWRARLGL